MPEQHEAAASVQTALQALQAAVLAQQEQQKSGASSATDSSSTTSALSRLSVCLQDLLQRQSVLEQSLEDRSIAESALRRVVANNDAAAVRLQSEISRLRHAQAAAEAAGTAAAPSPALDAAGRQALLDAAVAAKEKPIAAVLQLQSEAAACQARISTLEAELAAAAADNSSRLAEQQKAFLAKLEQVRQVHAQQLAAATGAEASAKECSQRQQEQLQELQQALAQSQQQHQQQQLVVASLQQQLAEMQSAGNRTGAAQQQHRQASGKISVSTDQQPGTAANTAHDSSGNANSPAEPAVLNSGAKAAGSDAEMAGVGAAALQLMEEQLVRLSGIIKSHQEEIARLRQALMASCAERQQLQQQLQQQQQMQANQPAARQAASPGGLAAGVAAGIAGKGNSSGSSNTSPVKANVAGAAARVPAAAALAPIRSTNRNLKRP